MKHRDPYASHVERRRLLRFAADRMCLWCVCGNRACRRARACRGAVPDCGHLMAAWLAALETEKQARPSFAAMESQIETAEELTTYRAWRAALEREVGIAQEDPASVAEDREWLRRQILALSREAEA